MTDISLCSLDRNGCSSNLEMDSVYCIALAFAGDFALVCDSHKASQKISRTWKNSVIRQASRLTSTKYWVFPWFLRKKHYFSISLRWVLKCISAGISTITSVPGSVHG